ncbi:LCP family protein [Janibacter cremeus]|uniref:LCP family protein required for cell wall assembly n=1 Tax=Janibacter cremeus TaxID=1285192 RepID=A0A852VS64_9MICO|nr:LCP family protein [Janibacter cremeus]NYF99106.1 LCP family protein required for cell wall assembly [Janibacter cremeus]
MPDRPSRPRRPSGDPPSGGRDDDAIVFDARRGRRDGDDTARAIPTGRRERPARPAGGGQSAQRPHAARRPPASGGEPSTRVMPTGTPPSRPAGEGPHGGRPARATGGTGGAGGAGGRGPARPRRRRPGRTFVSVLLVLVLAWVAGMFWAVSASWAQVGKVDASPDGDRPSSDGRNVLLVGSDSRAGLTSDEQKRLGTGSDTGGARTDSILVLHTGSGPSTLVSIPRDSYVEIPGHGMNKINASFSIGGAELLTETIEHNTGLKMDGYMEIGFGGFAHVVDAVDGVEICVKNAMDDEKAHINLQPGCQVLDGKTALGYVRARYSDPKGDLGRAQRQREFLGALTDKVISPANLLLPWRVHALGTSSAGALTVGEDDSMISTALALWAFRGISSGDGNSLAVPTSNTSLPTPAGTAVQWDEARAEQLFADLRADEPLSITPDDG